MPDKSPDAFRTISEVADWLGVQPHVLRFWESKFSQVRPVKRAGGRRYYRPGDMLLLGGIRKLLHEDGLTIKGAQKVLREEGMSHVAGLSRPLDAESAALSDTGFEEDAFEDDAIEGEAAAPSAPPHDPLVAEEPAHVTNPAPDGAPSGEGRPKVDSAAPPREEPLRETPPLPSFRRSAATRQPPEPEPQDREPSHEEEAQADRLPSFLQAPREEETPAASPVREAELPLSFPAAPEEPATGPDAVPGPRPHVVDAPDPDESRFAVAPGALSAAVATTSISPRQRADLLPLVARLAALRDRMAAARDR